MCETCHHHQLNDDDDTRDVRTMLYFYGADCGRVRLRTQIRSNSWIRGRIFYRTLRTRTDADHKSQFLSVNFMGVTNEARSAWFRGGQCLITVQLP